MKVEVLKRARFQFISVKYRVIHYRGQTVPTWFAERTEAAGGGVAGLIEGQDACERDDLVYT